MCYRASIHVSRNTHLTQSIGFSFKFATGEKVDVCVRIATNHFIKIFPNVSTETVLLSIESKTAITRSDIFKV